MSRHLTAVDGPPGVGKTTRIIERAAAGELDAVITYGNDAARVLLDRAPGITAGTVYSLTWRAGASKFSKATGRGRRSAAPHKERAITAAHDPALDRYVREAPSRRRTKPDLLRLQVLIHSWDGTGEPDFDLAETAEKVKHEIALARWLAEGAPFADDFDGFSSIALDESQDFSRLELASAMALLRPGGRAWAYGDPGQSIYGEAKGMVGDALPAAWDRADARELMVGGRRCGDPLASAATQVLAPYWSRPAASFTVEGRLSEVLPWDIMDAPARGLVLGYSRKTVENWFVKWGLRETCVAPNLDDPDRNLVLCTAHAAKGAEADDVYLLPNKAFTKRVADREPGALRLAYVAMTRARRRFFAPRSFLAVLPK